MSSFSNNTKAGRSYKFLEAVIYILFLFGPLTGNIINVLFNVLSTEFSILDPTSILIAIPAFMFPFAITQLFSGVISDLKGRFPVLIIGLIIFGIAMLLAALSISLTMYAMANILGGIGFGLINPVLIALLTDITAPQNIPKKMGYLGASANLGVGLGPLIASQMILIGWRSIYILFIGITIFGLLYLIFSKRPPQKIPEESGISVLISQISKELRRSVVLLMIFSAIFISHTYLAINIWTSRVLLNQEGFVGLILGIAGVGAALTGMVTGPMIKKKGVRLPIEIGSILLITALVILLLIRDITLPENYVFLGIGWIISGLAGGILFPTLTYYSQVLSPKRRGALAGLLTAGYFIGIALVPTTLAPIAVMYGITGIYICVLGISGIFVITLFLLYRNAKKKVFVQEPRLHEK
ncbi:MAG: MFS transporter [Promethearchaeota archaeon]